MKQSKLHIALSSISKSEWKSLRKYVIMESSESSDIYLLFQHLHTVLQSPNAPLDKEEIKQSLFPSMNEKSYLNLNSRLFLIFEEWLVWYDNKKDKYLSGVQLVKFYNRRGLFSLADKIYSKTLKSVQKINKASLHQNDHLHNLYKNHYFSENPVKENEGKDFLENLVTAFTNSYKEKAQLYLSELNNWGTLKQYDYAESIDTLSRSIEYLPESNSSVVTKYIKDMAQNNDVQSLNKLSEMLLNNKILPGSDLEVFVTLYSIRYSLILHHSNKIKDINLASKLYDYGLNSGILMNLGKLSTNKFLNIISVIIVYSEPEVVYSFISKWLHLIVANERNAAEILAKCYVKRKEEKYEDILQLIREAYLPSTSLVIRALAFQIKAFYKIGEYDLAQNLINNLKRRTRKLKPKISGNRYISRLNFLHVMELLIKNEHTKIHININDYQHLHHKVWLSKQVNIK